MSATAKKMWDKEGVESCFTGVVPGLVGMAPFAAIDLGTFEGLIFFITLKITSSSLLPTPSAFQMSE